jgi:acyl-CoA synthetase (AMP-forming)/AMP-acid ligase II
VFPREVEDYLYSHPAIADVSVFGVADKVMGEEIAAYIVLKEGYTAAEDEPEGASAGHHHSRGHGHAGNGTNGHPAAPAADSKAVAPHAIKAFCRGHIAHYKVPKYVRFVPGFPTTGSGKIQKVRASVWMGEACVGSGSGDSLRQSCGTCLKGARCRVRDWPPVATQSCDRPRAWTSCSRTCE